MFWVGVAIGRRSDYYYGTKATEIPTPENARVEGVDSCCSCDCNLVPTYYIGVGDRIVVIPLPESERGSGGDTEEEITCCCCC